MGYFLGNLRPVASFALATTSSRGFPAHRSLHVESFFQLGSTSSLLSPTALRATDSNKNKGLCYYSTHEAFNDEIIDQYDAFILDQFGVMHNGIEALDGAVELVNYLYKEKKKKPGAPAEGFHSGNGA